MENIKKYEPLWGTWHVESLIGEGSFGKVYKIRCQEFNKTYHSAVKIISLPQKNSEIQGLESKGLDKTGIHSFYRTLASNIASEIDLMSQFNSRSFAAGDPLCDRGGHILSFEDYKICENPSKIGWDILIRMEFLQPLSDYLNKKSFSSGEVIDLGIHICRALELFHLKKIIHQGIKPTNIFITPYGTFKLGDFGIDRQLRRTLSKKKASAAMPPEVFKSEHCDVSTDIYSLGILMYSLLNQKRTPFLPDFPQSVTFADYKNAFMRRINGEPIPALMGITPELNALLLKACAYKRADRFYGPAEMRKALETLKTATASSPKHSSHGAQPRTPQYFNRKHTVPTVPTKQTEQIAATTHTTQIPKLTAQTAKSVTHTGYITESVTHAAQIIKPVTNNERAIQPKPAHENRKTSVSSPPPLSPKIAKKTRFLPIERKHLLLITGLASALALLATIAVIANVLTIKYGISVNGQTTIILSDKKEAQAVLDELESHYSRLASSASINVSSVTYEEPVNIVKARAPASEIKNKDEALQALINGRDQTTEYTLTQEETLQEIAQKYNITTEAIIAENEDLTITVDTLQSKDLLPEGITIKLPVSHPYLHVVIEGIFQTTEEIDIEVIAEKKDTLLQNTTKVQQEGEKGFRDATYAVVLKNNVPVEKTIIEETIHKEMVPKIIHEGSRPPRPGADSEQLKYIINRESTGNVRATNGQYKGLGQLLDKYYQTYVNMSYAETLQQPDPYAVQVDAMLGYILARYGSIEAAYNHWIQKHWY